MKHGTLVLVRHGESRMNVLNRFTGWIDIPLSNTGIKEAQKAAEHCKQFEYDAAFTSNLMRAHETLLIILAQQKKMGVFLHSEDERYNNFSQLSTELSDGILPIIANESLNERNYGNLQGRNKAKVMEEFGEAQVLKWRRGYKDKPPDGESLAAVYERTVTYFQKNIHPKIRNGENILISAHGNTLRAIIKFLEQIDDDQISSLDLPTGTPIVYTCEEDIFTRTDGEYRLDRPLR